MLAALQPRKLALAAASLTLASSAAWLVLSRERAEAPTVVVVDNSAALEGLLDARRDEAATDVEEVGYPPPLVREPLDEETATLFFPAVKAVSWTYDPQCYSRRVVDQRTYFRELEEHPDGGWELRTNDYGMREDEDVLAEAPDVRILVTGDSHVDGVCAQSESLPNVLEALLTAERPGEVVESLNAGVGGFNLYNYVGMFERLRHLAPDLYVVVVYGGNDFSGAMLLQRYFEHRGSARSTSEHHRRLRSQGAQTLGSQEMIQETYFWINPEDIQPAVDLACSISVELERQCAEAGTELLFVYLPPPSRAQPAFYRKTARRFCEQAELEQMRLGISDRIADPWLRFLAERGIPAVDLRPYFRQVSELLYWRTDHHLNVVGHDLAAQILYDPVTELLARRESESR